jgi:hypothetical protein
MHILFVAMLPFIFILLWAIHSAVRRNAEAKKAVAEAEWKRIQEALFTLYPEPKLRTRYLFEGRSYSLRTIETPQGPVAFFKEMRRD